MSENSAEVQQSSTTINKTIKEIASPDRNRMLFGTPYRVWWWYFIGPSKKEKGLKYWLRKKIGEPPVFFSLVNEELTAESMEAWLENEGYFNSKVGSDTVRKGYKCYARYSAHIERPYLIDTVQ